MTKNKENCIYVECDENGECSHHFIFSKKKEMVCIACGYKIEEK